MVHSVLFLTPVESAERGINDIKMPPKMLKKGRPKGAGLTVIGLPKKRDVKQPSPFLKKSSWEKIRGKKCTG